MTGRLQPERPGGGRRRPPPSPPVRRRACARARARGLAGCQSAEELWLSHCPELRVARTADAEGRSWALLGLAIETREERREAPIQQVAGARSAEVPEPVRGLGRSLAADRRRSGAPRTPAGSWAASTARRRGRVGVQQPQPAGCAHRRRPGVRSRSPSAALRSGHLVVHPAAIAAGGDEPPAAQPDTRGVERDDRAPPAASSVRPRRTRTARSTRSSQR